MLNNDATSMQVGNVQNDCKADFTILKTFPVEGSLCYIGVVTIIYSVD